MNIFPYEVKRAHWSMNTAARNEFARICKEEKVPELKWMTPGRYDVGWAALRAARAIFRRRPQNFLRARIGEWFGQIAFPDTLESLRAMQDIMKRLASTFGLHSHPIHDVRCDLLREGLMWPTPHVYVRGRFRLPMPRSRRQTFG